MRRYWKLNCWLLIGLFLAASVMGGVFVPFAAASDDSDLSTPTLTTAMAYSNSSVMLMWTNVKNEDGYIVMRKTGENGSWSQAEKIDGDNSTYVDMGLKNKTTYYYKVKAYNEDGYSDYSNVLHVKTLGGSGNADEDDDSDDSDLNAPMILFGYGFDDTVNLIWSDNSSDESGYLIERKHGKNGIYRAIKKVSKNKTWFFDDEVETGETYYYRVRAYDGSGYSKYSPVAMVYVWKAWF